MDDVQFPANVQWTSTIPKSMKQEKRFIGVANDTLIDDKCKPTTSQKDFVLKLLNKESNCLFMSSFFDVKKKGWL